MSREKTGQEKGMVWKQEELYLHKMGPEEAGHVYETYMRKDFPKNELKPLTAIQNMMDKDMYDCLGLYEKDSLRAYAFFVTDRKSGSLLLDYLAVCEPYRGSGLGSLCLGKIREFYKEDNGILLECESLESAGNEEEMQVRERRIRFYQENGCIRTGISSQVFGVEFEILYMPLKEGKADTERELERLYRKMMPGEMFEKYVGRIGKVQGRIG